MITLKLALFVGFWMAAAVVGIYQGAWYYQAHVRPRTEMTRLLGSVPDGAHILAYEDRMGIRGGHVVWNIGISAAAAQELRSRCSESAEVLPLNLIVTESEPARGLAEGQLEGCMVAIETGSRAMYARIILQGNLIQLLIAT